MKIRQLLLALAMAIPAMATQTAMAHQTVYVADLLGSSETPPASTPGSGTSIITVDFDLLTMRVQASFADLIGTTTAAHIHCCTTDPFTGNAGVATQLPSFTGFPLGVSSGSYDHTFDMALASSYNPAFITGHGGTVSTAFVALTQGLDAGTAYMNIHTTAFGGGEIRALLSPVPEPETYGLMLAGLAMMGILRRRRGNSAT